MDSEFESDSAVSSTIVAAPKRKGAGIKEKTIEQRYQKKTPIDHILHRPESYIGSVQPDVQSLWVWNDKEQRMVYRPVNFVPGLYKIFDEILVNAADVKAREENERVAKMRMTSLKVDIDQEAGTISVWNDGEGIPIEIHKEHNIYVPELIFGHLLTSDNYDDTEERVTGGRNGYGAKLTNIFSKTFNVECVDSCRKRKFKKTWRNNMSSSDTVKISDCKDKDFVKVTFTPDLARFQISAFDDDFVSLLTKRVYDVAGCCGVKVWLNGRKLPVDGFKNYVDLYFPPVIAEDSLLSGVRKPPLKIHEKNGRWEVVISMSDGQSQQVSFVNSIATVKGGSHVNYVLDPLVQAILKKVNTKNKGGMELKAHHVKAHIWIFVNCLIVNPTFDSQTKETLTLKASQFGSKLTLSDKTINAVVKSEIVESVLLWAKTKQQVELQKKMKGVTGKTGRDRITGIPKLEDANDAGTKLSESCTLILTEGESAKTSCVAGLSVVGRDRYGVFPLKGKLLNVREASFKQQVENQEIQAILKIMGLQVGKKFDSPKGLRYGSLMMMADQDLDGSHIKGLLINMIAHYWPQLLQYRGFLKEFVTPIVKVSKKDRQLAFFTLVEYEDWRRQNSGGKGWKVRYYKGLGTSSDKEFKEYFSQLERHSLEFVYEGVDDLNSIDLAFNGKRAEDRKQWIQGYQDGTFVDHSQPTVTYTEFINKELVVFSKYDAFRSIPNCIDGLKPVQRKVLFATFKRNLKAEIKVAQLTGYISEKAAYHHGEASLGATIVGMAQTFVGSNNINLLQPCGQFGSRKEGGKDCSAVRYIFTRLSAMTRAIFPEADDALLEYQNDDGLMVEPKFYVPVIPLVLANGVEGIGTGWSTSIPNYNPRELVSNIRKFIRGEPMEPLTPWYRGFKGKIERKGAGGFESVGIIAKIDDETVEVTELPIKMWTQNFKQFLEDSLSDGSAVPASNGENSENQPTGRGRARAAAGAASSVNSSALNILDYRDNSTHESVLFTIKLSPSQMAKAEKESLEKAFKLRKPIGTTNMTLFDHDIKVQRYITELDIIREFGQLRLQFYELRRAYLIEKLQRECRILQNKVRFIQAIVEGSLTISNRKRDAIIKDLLERNFDPLTKIHRASTVMWRLEEQRRQIESELNNEETAADNDKTDAAADVQVKQEETAGLMPAKEFEYLLGMSLWALSAEKINDLAAQMKVKQVELEDLEKKTPEDLWDSDISVLEKALDDQDGLDMKKIDEDQAFRVRRRNSLKAFNARGVKNAGKKPAVKARGAKGRGKAKVSTEDFIVDNSEESDISDSVMSSLETDSMAADDSAKPAVKHKTPKQTGAKSGSTSMKAENSAPTGKSDIWSVLDKSYMTAASQQSSSTIAPKRAKSTKINKEADPSSPKPLVGYSLADRIKSRTIGSAVAVASSVQNQATDTSTIGPVFDGGVAADRRQQTLEEMLGISSSSVSAESSTPVSSSTPISSSAPSEEPLRKRLATKRPKSYSPDDDANFRDHSPSPPKKHRVERAVDEEVLNVQPKLAPVRRRLLKKRTSDDTSDEGAVVPAAAANLMTSSTTAHRPPAQRKRTKTNRQFSDDYDDESDSEFQLPSSEED